MCGEGGDSRLVASYLFSVIFRAIFTVDPAPTFRTPHSPVVEARQTQNNQKSNQHGGTQQHTDDLHLRLSGVDGLASQTIYGGLVPRSKSHPGVSLQSMMPLPPCFLLRRKQSKHRYLWSKGRGGCLIRRYLAAPIGVDAPTACT